MQAHLNYINLILMKLLYQIILKDYQINYFGIQILFSVLLMMNNGVKLKEDHYP